MTKVCEILAACRQAGIAIRVEGSDLIVRPKPDGELRARLIENKPEILSYLNETSKQDISSLVAEPKAFTRLELACDALAKLIPDIQAQRRIRALAEADARNWRFLGGDGYRHILAGNIMDQIEKATGKLICFKGTHDVEKFAGWFVREARP